MTRQRFGRAAPLAVAATLILAACETERSSVFEPIGPPAFDFGVSGDAAGLPSGTAAVGATSVTVTVANLRALASGSYQVWAVRRNAQNLDAVSGAFGPILEFFLRDSMVGGMVVPDPITGDPIQVTDTTVISSTRANLYSGSDDPAVFAVEFAIDSIGDGSVPSANHAVVISLEATGGATAPSAAQFLWRRIGPGGSGPLSFGTFGGSDVVNTISPTDYVFRVGGSGLGGVRGNEFSVSLREITRPPLGFFYRGFLVDENGVGTMVDTLRSEFNADTSLSRVSLFNADSDPLLPGVAGQNILAGQVRNCVSGSAVLQCANSLTLSPADASKPFAEFAAFLLALEPKGAAAVLGATSTLSGEVPEEVKN